MLEIGTTEDFEIESRSVYFVEIIQVFCCSKINETWKILVKTSVRWDINFTMLLSMLKVNIVQKKGTEKSVYINVLSVICYEMKTPVYIQKQSHEVV